jgi:hypothetical protein
MHWATANIREEETLRLSSQKQHHPFLNYQCSKGGGRLKTKSAHNVDIISNIVSESQCMRQFKAITRHGRIVKRNSNNHWATLRPVDWLDKHPIHLHKKPEITMAAGSMVY